MQLCCRGCLELALDEGYGWVNTAQGQGLSLPRGRGEDSGPSQGGIFSACAYFPRHSGFSSNSRKTRPVFHLTRAPQVHLLHFRGRNHVQHVRLGWGLLYHHEARPLPCKAVPRGSRPRVNHSLWEPFPSHGILRGKYCFSNFQPRNLRSREMKPEPTAHKCQHGPRTGTWS